MQMSRNGRSALAREEAVVLVGYPDSRRIPTDGVGHTAGAGGHAPVIGHKITLADAMDTFAADLARFEGRVLSLVTVPLAQNELDALVMFDFNTGGLRYKSNRTKKLVDSGLLKAINGRKGDAAIKAGFLAWSRAGSDAAELKPRRLREFALFDRGDYGTIDKVPVSDVWPPRYKMRALPQIIAKAAVEPDETVAAVSLLPAPSMPPVQPTDYDPETDGPAFAEPPPPLTKSRTLWGNITGVFSGLGGGWSLSEFFQNPNAVWILAIGAGFLLVGGIAVVIVFRERIAKRLELGI